METDQEILTIVESNSFFDLSTLPLYLLGFLTFVATILDDWLNPKKEFKPIAWYFQEFLYTVISIALGLSICFAMEVSKSWIWIVAILSGLLGSSVLRTIKKQKEVFAELFVNRIKNKLGDENFEIKPKSKKSKKENIETQTQENHIQETQTQENQQNLETN